MFQPRHDHHAHKAHNDHLNEHFSLSVLGVGLEGWLGIAAVLIVVQLVRAWRMYDKLKLGKGAKAE